MVILILGQKIHISRLYQDLVKNGAKELPITDTKMTRFWLKLEQAVELVLFALKNMYGGELFVKKIPSMHMPDLAKAIAPDLPIKEIGIGPGEKIHEQMITKEDAPFTVEFDDFYIILPQININRVWDHYKGAKRVPPTFEYNSGSNDWWLTIPEMQKLISEL